ncbi:hypothetical protein TSA66_16955 [Noviherbaspirillum autotrophicum]|uniref:Uncharacterized protein n=1 Tax=Noviherbaspirillum autotrophicum TaxID=709839 RepID=A0A0C1Y4Z7_9BURK|nr:hypothetical protein TSA66_16955 [Noviherbaspirillum autotrophicum]
MRGLARRRDLIPVAGRKKGGGAFFPTDPVFTGLMQGMARLRWLPNPVVQAQGGSATRSIH